MNTPASIEVPPPLFKSVTELRREHTALLTEFQNYGDVDESNLPGPFIEKVEFFLQRAGRSGTLLNVEEDRLDAQALLNYWTTVLYNAGRAARPTILAKFEWEAAAREAGERCPYKGLGAFNQQDRPVFFGRRQLVREMTGQLERGNFLAVVGLSGSGKSSVVRAGLIPALQDGALPGSESWKYYDPIVPGPEPLRSLAELTRPAEFSAEDWYQRNADRFLGDERHLLGLLSGVETATVVVIDQFEEMFTLARNEREQHAAVKNLIRLASSPGTRRIVVMTMRSEFDTYVARFPELHERFEAAQVRVTPLSPLDLRKAIERPAERSGITFEAGLVEELVQQVLGEPAGLPLLQFTLYKLWEKRQGRDITRAVYRELGGSPREVLANVADATYDYFKFEEDRRISRRIMLRLVRPGAGLDVTSNRVTRAALYEALGARDNVDRVLDVWVKAGLLRVTPGARREDDQVEVMHEALIRNWPKLADWLDEERGRLRKRLQLTSAAQQWAEHKRDPGGLLGGTLLAEALTYDDLNELEETFVRESKLAAEAAAEREREQLRKLIHEQEERANQKARALRYLRLLTVSLVLLLFVTAWGAYKVWSQSKEAQRQRDAAVKEKELSNNLRIRAEGYEIDAKQQRDEAEKQRTEAEKQKTIAEEKATTAEQALKLAESEKKRAEVETLKAKEAYASLKVAAEREIRLRKEREEADRRAQLAQEQADEASEIAQIAKVAPQNIIKPAAALDLRGINRPLRPGVSISSTSTTAGSLCCVVRDPTGQIYLLSMSYTIQGIIGDSILQPSVYDGGTEKDRVAVLANINSKNTAALARLLPGITASNEIPGVGTIKGVAPPVKPGDVVILVGRTSGAVKGRVRQIHARIQISTPDGLRVLEDVIFTDKISNPGDGGAPVLDEQGRLIGIHWGGSADTSIIIPIQRILQEFNVELVR